MAAAEVWFLRAEAALRGFTSEDVESCYKQGVTTSFAQWDASGVSEYLESENTPADYVDTFDKNFDAKATTSITPKWDNTADNETKLERIITPSPGSAPSHQDDHRSRPSPRHLGGHLR